VYAAAFIKTRESTLWERKEGEDTTEQKA